MTEIAHITEIQELVVQGFMDWKSLGNVSVRSDVTGDLLIFSYTDMAQYEGRWNYFERVSRGLIVHRKTGEIVARAFDKFYNWGELGQVSTAPIASVTEKLDGSLGILYRHDGYKIATRGSFTNEQSQWASKALEQFHLDDLEESWTLLFEIIYPENRVIVDYGAYSGLVLLAIRNRFTGEYLPFSEVRVIAEKYSFDTPKVFDFSDVREIQELLQTLNPNQEGWIVEFADGQRYKFKGVEYLKLHKLVSGMSFKNTLEAHQSGNLEYILQTVPDEFLAEFKLWVAEIDQTIANTRDKMQAIFEQAPQSSRKDFALWVLTEHKTLAPYLFALMDEKDITLIIYKMAFEERVNEKPQRNFSE